MPLAVAVVLSAAPAFAAEPGTPRGFTFSALDLNLDYAITEEEAERSVVVERNFANMDLDRDGRLSPLEFNNLALALSVPPDPFPIDRHSSEDETAVGKDRNVQRL